MVLRLAEFCNAKFNTAIWWIFELFLKRFKIGFLPWELPSAKRGTLLSAKIFLCRLYKNVPTDVDGRADVEGWAVTVADWAVNLEGWAVDVESWEVNVECWAADVEGRAVDVEGRTDCKDAVAGTAKNGLANEFKALIAGLDV